MTERLSHNQLDTAREALDSTIERIDTESLTDQELLDLREAVGDWLSDAEDLGNQVDAELARRQQPAAPTTAELLARRPADQARQAFIDALHAVPDLATLSDSELDDVRQLAQDLLYDVAGVGAAATEETQRRERER